MKKKSLAILVLIHIAVEILADTTDMTIYSATKSNQSIQDITSDIEIITGAELETKHITGILEALKLVNISVNQSGGIGQQSSFFMQGMSAEHTLVLIDGIRYNDPTTPNGQALLDHIFISTIDRIEIIKGAQSGIWGADAAAGIINIITKKNTNNTVKFKSQYGSFNTKKLGLSINTQNEKQNFGFHYSSIKSDSFSAYAPNLNILNTYENDAYKNDAIQIKYGLNINSNNKINISHLLINAKGKFDSEFPTNPNDIKSKFTNKNKLTDVIFTQQNSFNIFDFYFKQASFERTLLTAFGLGEYDGSTKEFGIKSKIQYKDNHFLIIGLDKKNQLMNKSYSVLKGEYNSKGYFLTNSNTLSNVIFTQSMRFDDYNNFKDKATGKLGIKYNLTNNIDIFANYGTAYKTPSLFNLHGNIIGNINLIPEDIKSYDLKLKYQNISFSHFNTRIKNEIIFDNQTFTYTQNIKPSIYKGYTVQYKQSFNTSLLNMKYLRQLAKDIDGNDLPRREHEKLYLSYDYFGLKNFNFNVNGEYIGKRFDDIEKQNSTGNYSIFNSSINYNHSNSLLYYLKINNIFNKKYHIVDQYASSPRAFYMGLNAKF